MGNKSNREPILSVENLKIEFHDHASPETAVEDFDLELFPGEIVGFVGESGSGKSLSAMAIAGLLNRKSLTKSGRIMFQGKELLTCSRSVLRTFQGDEISMIFQEPNTSLNPVKKIGWQIEESLRIHHLDVSPAKRKERAVKMLADVGMYNPEKIYEMYPHELSGGMRQRVMIAAAMIGNPQILIADEPTTALDVTVQAQIVELLRKINREKGTAIIFISHDLSLVRQLCSRVLVMQKGKVVESGDTEQIFNSPKNSYTKELIAAIPVVDIANDTEYIDEFKDSEDVLKVKDLNVYYRNHKTGLFSKSNRQQILKSVSLSMKKGEILGLVGESGSGKSTLAKTIVGINKDFEGTIQKTDDYPQMIFQDPYGSLNPGRSVRWILRESLRADRKKKWTEEEIDKRMKDVLTQVELPLEYLDRMPSQLSGGQRQRVSIALSLMQRPDILIADEPVSALDVTIQAQILKLLEHLHEKLGISILFISHDLRVVYHLCDHVAIMKKGKIVEFGQTRDIYKNPQADYTKELLQSAGIVDLGI